MALVSHPPVPGGDSPKKKGQWCRSLMLFSFSLLWTRCWIQLPMIWATPMTIWCHCNENSIECSKDFVTSHHHTCSWHYSITWNWRLYFQNCPTTHPSLNGLKKYNIHISNPTWTLITPYSFSCPMTQGMIHVFLGANIGIPGWQDAEWLLLYVWHRQDHHTMRCC